MAAIPYDSPYKATTKEITWDTSSPLDLTTLAKLDGTRAFRLAISSLPALSTISLQGALIETPSQESHWLTISSLNASGFITDFDNHYKIMPHKVRLKQTAGATTSNTTKVFVVSKHIPPELTKP
ncbi:hypothetical protein UFOVP755_88 [uncultured Caudovirales phage]|uniref:Uncharacterized protein n=1 Tax=uncultured Caudovirales phage TaxID=2100421 RepID=A0A6J7XBC4_9CAUD|nr:hypothetical protein UFOVP755_88 [uncultured Caudovirales phage]